MEKKEDWLAKQFPTSEKSSASNKDRPSTQIFNETILVAGLGIQAYGRLLLRRFYYVIPATYGVYWTSGYIVRNAYHLKYLHWLEPTVFTYKVLQWFYRFSYDAHLWTIFILISIPVFLVLGFLSRFTRTKYQQIFASVSLINGLGVAPALTTRIKLGAGREKLIFDGKGVGISRFESKKDDLENSFNRDIEKIEPGKSPKFIVLTLSKSRIPEHVTFNEVAEKQPLRPYSFYLGKSAQGVEQVCFVSFPHWLAAGTTGYGKSTFCKQAVLGILMSSPHIQVYLIDLKGGLEMVDFTEAPNVRVIKTMAEAVALLKKIKAEMKSRFAHLESKKKKEIDPKRDKRDRIVVAIDEASVLYMDRSKNDRDAALADQARALTDEIAKLSRAAAIHLFLATQRVTKETIDTNIQENISGRMCFKMNTLPGSLLVLHTDEATNKLPDKKGRGIWLLGNKKVTVQVPNVSDVDILERCSRIKAEFEKGLRKLFNPMIEIGSGTDDPGSKLQKAVETIAPSVETKTGEGKPESDDQVRKLLNYLYENKIATMEQIRRDLFPNFEKRSVTRKLKNLEENGLLQGYYDSSIGRKKLYGISTKAFNAFVAPSGTHLPQVLKSEVPMHDLVLTDIRRQFVSSRNVKHYWTENLVAAMKSSDDDSGNFSFDGVNPDGLVDIEVSGAVHRMALEYESARKYNDRYEQLFESYYANTSIAGVLFVCKDSNLLGRVRSIELATKPDERVRRIYYSDLSQWGHGPILFSSLTGGTIRLDPMSNSGPIEVPTGQDDPEGPNHDVDEIADDSEENQVDSPCGLYRDASVAASNVSTQSNPPPSHPIP